MRRCAHEWVEVARHFTPPNPQFRSVERATESLLLRLIGGWTNIEMLCTLCGDLKFIEVNGRA